MKNTVMKKFFVGLFSLLMGVGSAFAQTNMSSEMYDLAKMKEGLRNRRVSSYDRTGNNRDHLKAIKPGETAVLADIKGAGVINHIWITMSPGPRQLSRNDIILRRRPSGVPWVSRRRIRTEPTIMCLPISRERAILWD